MIIFVNVSCIKKINFLKRKFFEIIKNWKFLRILKFLYLISYYLISLLLIACKLLLKFEKSQIVAYNFITYKVVINCPNLL